MIWQMVTEMSASCGAGRGSGRAPTALAVLTVEDQVDGAVQLGVEFLAQGAVVDHAGDLGEKERAEAVAVHGAVRRIHGIVQEAGMAAGRRFSWART